MPHDAPTRPDAVAPELAPPDVSIVVPVFNEAGNLPILHRELRAALAGRRFEVLYVDDGSTDGSDGLLREIAATDGRVRVLRFARNSGQSAAFAAGFAAARAPVVVTLDADLQNDPSDIPRLLEKVGEYDVVCGVRSRRQDSWVRRLSSRIANGVRNRMTHESIADVGCSLRACRRDYLQRLRPFSGMHRFLPTLLRMEGARVTEVPVGHRPRGYGVTKYSINNRLWRGLADLWGVRWLQKRRIDLGSVEEVTRWTASTSGSGSDSPDRPSSSVDSSSSGSPRSVDSRA